MTKTQGCSSICNNRADNATRVEGVAETVKRCLKMPDIPTVKTAMCRDGAADPSFSIMPSFEQDNGFEPCHAAAIATVYAASPFLPQLRAFP